MPASQSIEIEVGLAKATAGKHRRAQLNDLLAFVDVLPFGREEAAAAASIRSSLERRGLPIGPLDNLIAGTAQAHQATLVTHNVGEFSRIAGLKVVDWYI